MAGPKRVRPGSEAAAVMNTPAHAVLNLVLLSRGARPAAPAPVLFGALLPDLPMFLFYLWERLLVGLPEREIWSRAYYEPGWWVACSGPGGELHSTALRLIRRQRAC